MNVIYGPDSHIFHTLKEIHSGASKYSLVSFKYADYEGCRITCQDLALDAINRIKRDTLVLPYSYGLIYTETLHEHDEIILHTFITDEGIRVFDNISKGYYVNIETHKIDIATTLLMYENYVNKNHYYYYKRLHTLASIDDRFKDLFKQMRSNKMFDKMIA